MTPPPVRVMLRTAAIHEIADLARGKQHWIIGTTPHTADRIAYQIPDTWKAVVYLDAGSEMVMVGDRRIVQATTALDLFEICAIFIIQKKLVSVKRLNKMYRQKGFEIPADGSQDILMFSEPLDEDVAAIYTPTIILEVASEIDGKDYLKEWRAST